MKSEMLNVIDSNGIIQEKYAVLVHNGGERYSVITARQCKHYKKFASVEKFLNKYGLRVGL